MQTHSNVYTGRCRQKKVRLVINRKGGRPWWILPAMSRHLVTASSSGIITTTSDIESSEEARV
jgi:hypothetical protein